MKETIKEELVDKCKSLNEQTETNCKKIIDDTEEKINDVFRYNFGSLNKAVKNFKKGRFIDLLWSFASCIILTVFIFLAVNYSFAYIKGINKARSEAIEILEEEREKIKEEAIEEYKLSEQFLKDANGKRADIKKREIEAYKNSDDYLEDACKLVAQNIQYTNCLYYLHKYMQSSTLNEYPKLKRFDDEYLKGGWQQYKNEQKKK